MKKIIVLLFCIVLLFPSLNAFAQTNPTGEISGNVIDDQEKALDYVSVALLKAQDSTLIRGSFTSASGNYTFDHLPEGDYVVAFNMVGYAKVVQGPFSINPRTRSYKTIVRLKASTRQLNGINIIGRKPLVERQIDKTILNIENSILATGNTAMDILRKAPGVSVDKDGALSLRGKSGVNVMIDGKPTYLSSEELANLLRSTEGNAIQSIELITNPSSKYDASGNSGIINIKLKKNRSFGTNGSVTAGGGYGRYYKANSGLSFNHREEKFNVFGDVNYSRNKRYVDRGIDRFNNTTTDKTFFNQTSFNPGIRNNLTYKGGIDYFMDEKNTIGIAANGYATRGNDSPDVLTRIGSQLNEVDSIINAPNKDHYKYNNLAFNLNYRGVIDTSGQEINIDADHSIYHRDRLDEYNNNYMLPDGQTYKVPFIFRNFTPSVVKIWAFKADYSYPVDKKTKLDAGVKTSFVNTDNNSVFENLVDGEFQNDITQTNHFIYDENINAAYANLRKELSSTTIQLGLRAEQTNSKGNSVTVQNVVTRHYLNLFPSVFVNHVLSADHEIGFSYSRRIDRPDYLSLNPFVRFIDAFTYGVGNPFLKPQFTNSFELSYTYKKKISATLGYSNTTDVITGVVTADTLKKTLFYQSQNLAEKKAYNLNINYPLTITRWWTASSNLTVYYNKFSSPNLLGAPYSSGKTAYNFNTVQTVRIDPNTSAEASFYYNSKNIDGTILFRREYSLDLGVSRSFLNKKLNIKLAANDLFNTILYMGTSTIPSQNYTYREKDESRIFRLTATYRFGSSEIKAARKRAKSSDDEQSRVKS